MTYDDVSQALEYRDGKLFRISGKRTDLIGKEFGTLQAGGYIQGDILGSRQYAHRLVWLLCTGEMPKSTIDHINGDKTDNRIENLRDVSQAVNNQNLKCARNHNKSGLLGVTSFRDKFKANIRVHGKRFYLGCFDTAIEAHNAYMEAKRIKHSEVAA